MSRALSTIHGQYVCKDRERKISVLAIQSKKSCVRKILKTLLDIGDGKVTTDETGCIKLPTVSAQSLICKMLSLTRYFPMYTDNIQIMSGWQKVAKNVDINELNLKVQHLLPGDLVSYKSIDTVYDVTEAVNYPTEFLNSLDLPGMPPFNLQLKV
jgi:hypothetical protein